MKENELLKTLKNGLMALRLINEYGPINIANLARYLDITRTSAYRILATLESTSYVAKIPHTNRYQLAPEITELAAGFDEGARLAAVAEPIVKHLGESIGWPVSLSTPAGSKMLARVTTDFESPLALSRVKAGDMSPLAQTNLGILYLALSAPAHRNNLINMMISKKEFQLPTGWDRAELMRRIRVASENRYLMLNGRPSEGCVGVPILWRGRMLGGLVTRYIRSAISQREAAATLLPQFQKAALEIVTKFEQETRTSLLASNRRTR